VAGSLQPAVIRGRLNPNGEPIETVIARFGVDLERAPLAHARLRNIAACLELHIEQGPVLESLGLPLGVVMGAMGIQRHAIRFTGQSVHAGFTSMDLRRDALAAAARLELEIRQIAKRHQGLCTVGRVTCSPGIITALVGQCDVTLDQRHFDGSSLLAMLAEAKDASLRIAEEEKVSVEWSNLYHIEPTRFHPELVEFCAEAVQQSGCAVHRLPSGPLHDAAEICMAGVPAAMLFVQSLGGLSHIKTEDTREAHLLLGVEAFDRLVSNTMQWILTKSDL
jgi:beta-ureidopropionase / N-carbamoyl-L-amino-acid hydrolase